MPLDRQKVYQALKAPNTQDYEVYLDCEALLACQKDFDDLCNKDELQFQIVHQVEELWMKLLSYTLLDVNEYLLAANTCRVLTLMERCNQLVKLMTQQLTLLETMSPLEYQEIRLQLGQGSGQESPGFKTLMSTAPHLWESYCKAYLEPAGRTVRSVYDKDYAHDEAYMAAEALIEFDELVQKFRWHHIFLIHRSIGMGAASLKGRSVDLLQKGAQHRFFKELWDVRVEMTDEWGGEYGKVRPKISDESAAE